MPTKSGKRISASYFAGGARTLYTATMVTDSDVSESSDHMTELAKAIGMPQDLASGPVRVKSFHPLTVQGLYAFWYDSPATNMNHYSFVSFGYPQRGHAFISINRVSQLLAVSLLIERKRRFWLQR